MLGSELQSEWGYTGFRDTFILLNELEIVDTNIEKSTNTNDHYNVTVEAKDGKDTDETKNPILFDLIIGIENDQLRILNLDHENAS